MSDCAGETALLSSGAWGFPTWWEEDASRAAGGVGTTSIHYINFKITRYEMGPFFGMQLYSTNHGTVLVCAMHGLLTHGPLGYLSPCPSCSQVGAYANLFAKPDIT